MFQTSQIKHPHTAISPAAYKDIDAIGAKSHIKHLFIVSDELSFSSQSWNVPYRTGRVDAGSDNQARRQIVPV